MAASKQGYVNVVEMLLRKGASIDLQNKEGWTAVMCAADRGHVEVVDCDALVRKGENIDLRNKAGKTALMIADGKSGLGNAKAIAQNCAAAGIQNSLSRWRRRRLRKRWRHALRLRPSFCRPTILAPRRQTTISWSMKWNKLLGRTGCRCWRCTLRSPTMSRDPRTCRSR